MMTGFDGMGAPGCAQPPIDAATLTIHGAWAASAEPRPYDIRYCTQRHYLQLRVVGKWDEATFDCFASDYLSVLDHLAAHGGVTHLFVDASDFGLQPQAVAERFPDLIASGHRRPDQRAACVVPSLVNRVQARAGGDLINARYFRTAEDAADWLFSNEA